jgi:FkbM family methyltransferase
MRMDAFFSALNEPLRFSMIEVGAVDLGSKNEPFYPLLQQFPGSQIHGFELDPAVCAQMNASAPPGVKFHPQALGRREEERDLYLTNHPMCSSLYKPNDAYLALFQNLEVAQQKSKTTVRTVGLDHFSRKEKLGAIDFIKIDIQGAELDVFHGGEQTLKDVLMIVTEVEFVPVYQDQPLFGDVSAFLQSQGLSFHKFLGLAGRAIKPLIFKNNINFAVQHMWADAVFIRDLLQLQKLSDEQLLKLAVLADTYGSPDAVHYVLSIYDQRKGTAHAARWLERLTKPRA